MKTIISAIGIFSLVSVCYGSDYHSPRTAALAGAGRAGPLLNDAIVLNPSFSSFLPTYSMAASYLFFNGNKTELANGDVLQRTGRIYHFSVQDGRTEMLQAGAAFTQRDDAAIVHLGLSKAFLQRFAGGLSGKLLRDNGSGTFTGEMVFSLTGIFAKWIQLGIVADNLLQTEESVRHRMYREFILGTKFNIKDIVLVYFDPFWAPSLTVKEGGLGYSAGLEFVIMRDFFLRIGQNFNSYVPFLVDRGRGMGFGGGWVGPKLSIDYGFERTFSPTPASSHTFGATVYF